MKNLILAFCLLPLLPGCSSQSAKVEKDVALINNYVSAVENLDYDAMSNYLADDYVGVGPSVGDTIHKEQVISFWKDNVTTLYETYKYEQSKTLGIIVPEGPMQGEWVAHWAVLEVTYKDQRGGFTIMANTVYRVENDKIVRSFTFYNEADALEQLGYVFLNPDDLY